MLKFTDKPIKAIDTAPHGERINAYFPDIKACVAIRYYGDGAGWTFDDEVDYDFGAPTHWEEIQEVYGDGANGLLVVASRSPFYWSSIWFAFLALLSCFMSSSIAPNLVIVWVSFFIADKFWSRLFGERP